MPEKVIIYLIYPVRSEITPKNMDMVMVRDLCGHGIGTHLHEALNSEFQDEPEGNASESRYDISD